MEKEEDNIKGIDLAALRAEQLKLAKQLQLKDNFKLEDIKTIAGCNATFVPGKIITSIVVVNTDMIVLEEQFDISPVRFPYVPGYLAYRELPSLLKCYHKLESSPDVLIVNGNGILHPRGFGIASHFGLAVQKPTIGITKSLFLGEEKNNKVYVKNKIVAESLSTKTGSNPIFISQGNLISLKSAVEIIKKCLKEPHKFPEPLSLAHMYGRNIQKELSKGIKTE